MLWTLREWPLELINWNTSNAQRGELAYHRDGSGYLRQSNTPNTFTSRVLPPDERSQYIRDVDTGDALAVLQRSGSLASRPLLDEWIQLATLPESASGLNGRTCKQRLLACGTGPGTYCFRSSSKNANTVVLCVLVDSASVVHVRIQCDEDGSVNVLDLAAEELLFPSFDAALKHLGDHNTVRISDCMEIPEHCRKVLNQPSASTSVRCSRGGSRG